MNVWRMAVDEKSGEAQSEMNKYRSRVNCSWLALSHDGKKLIYSSLEQRANIFKMGFDPVNEKFIKPEIQITTGSKNVQLAGYFAGRQKDRHHKFRYPGRCVCDEQRRHEHPPPDERQAKRPRSALVP